ncbi:unnamed protein product [Closterium sp. NIES-65]|nr:unnamed protein product [Closterium sp. NIES-65]
MNDDRRPPALAAEAGRVSLRGESAADGGSGVPLPPAESADAASPLPETADLSARIPTRGAMTAAAALAQCSGGAGSTPIANRNAAAENGAALLISSSPSRHGFLRPTPWLDRATFPHWMLGSATATPVDHNRGVAASYSSSGDVVPSPATAAAARDSALASSGAAAAAALPLAPFASAMDALRATSHRTWEAAARSAAADLPSAAEDRSAQEGGLDGGSSSVALLDLAMQAAMRPVFSGAHRPLFPSPFRAPPHSMLPMTFSMASPIVASASTASADAATPAPGPPHLPFPPQISRLPADSCAFPPQFSADPRLFLTRLTQLQAADTVGAAAGSAFAASASAGDPAGAVAAHAAAAAAIAEGEPRAASLMDEGKREEGGGVVAVGSKGEWGGGYDHDGRGGGDLGGMDDVDAMMKTESDADVASGDNSGGGCSEDEEDDGHGGDEGHGGQEGQERHGGHGGHGEHGGNGRGHGGHEEKAGEEVKGQLQQSRQARQTQNQRGPQRLSRGSTRAASGPHQTRKRKPVVHAGSRSVVAEDGYFWHKYGQKTVMDRAVTR